MYRRRKRKRRRNFRPGYDRTGGYYGRFNNPKRRKLTIEKKFSDFTIGSDANPFTWAPSNGWIIQTGQVNAGSFLGINQGTKEGERIGRKIVITDLLWTIRFIIPTIAASTVPQGQNAWDNFRVILYVDKQCNGTAAVGNEIMDGTVQGYTNIENNMRFVILKDITINIQAPLQLTHDGTNDIQMIVEKTATRKIRWKGFLPIEYNNAFSDGRIETIRSNNICGMISSENTDTNTDPEMVSRIRVRFYG